MISKILLASAVFIGATVATAGVEVKKPIKHIVKETVAFEARMESGKKIWAPAETKVEAGKQLEITAHNSLPEPHGFTIAGYIEPQTIGAGETKTFTLTPKKSGDLKVSCQLHPAHVPATLKVK